MVLQVGKICVLDLPKLPSRLFIVLSPKKGHAARMHALAHILGAASIALLLHA